MRRMSHDRSETWMQTRNEKDQLEADILTIAEEELPVSETAVVIGNLSIGTNAAASLRGFADTSA